MFITTGLTAVTLSVMTLRSHKSYKIWSFYFYTVIMLVACIRLHRVGPFWVVYLCKYLSKEMTLSHIIPTICMVDRCLVGSSYANRQAR